MARFSKIWIAAAGLLGAPFAVHPAGLGELNLVSRLGQPLYVEIDIISGGTERVEESCFHLEKNRPGDGDIPRVTQARMSIKQLNGGRRLVVTTPTVIREPLLQMAVRIACGTDLVRDYALLLSPEEMRPLRLPTAAEPGSRAGALTADSPPGSRAAGGGALGDPSVQTPRSMALGLYPQSRRLQRLFAEALIAANPALDLRGETPIPVGAPLTLPDMRQVVARAAEERPPAATIPTPASSARQGAAETRKPRAVPRREGLQAADRLMIGGGDDSGAGLPGDPILRLATDLLFAATGADVSTPGRGNVSEAMREVFRVEYRVLAGMADPSSLPLDPAERKRWVQQSAAEFRRLADLLDGKTPGVEPAPMPPAPERAAPEPRPAPAPVPVSQPARATPAAPASTTPAWVDWLLFGGLLAAVAAVAGFLVYKRRSEFHARNGLDASADDDFPPVDDLWASVPAEQGGRVESSPGEQPEVPAAAPRAPDSAAPGQTPDTPRPPPRRQNPDIDDLEVGQELEEESHGVLELADIMLAFGRVKGAAEILSEFIETNPKEALQPWIKLLDVYRENGMRQEFEEVSERLNKTYNVQIERWDAADSVAEAHPDALRGNIHARSLEDFPRLLTSIDSLWGTPAALEFLDNLLRDNRDGQRAGFTREVAGEILFLSEVLAERLQSAT